jgi:NADH dehydrogenase [ubiquinone] 1 alpha subcomplex assembly factor 6
VNTPSPLGTAAPARRSGGGLGLSPAAALVRRYDRDRFQTALFAPVRDREALFALYAFNYEIARVRESVREPMLGQIRLQWWREAIATAYDGGAPRHHEVVEAITGTIRRRSLGRAHFVRLIDTRERDLDDAPPATMDALEDYAEGTSASLVTLALEALDAATPAAQTAARHVGIAYALAGLLRAMPLHAAAGRSFVPEDVAAEAGLDPAVPPRSTPALRTAVATIAARATQHLAAARAMRRELPATALPALLPARIAANALRRLERAGFDPFQGTAIVGDPLQSWRLAYAALTRRF